MNTKALATMALIAEMARMNEADIPEANKRIDEFKKFQVKKTRKIQKAFELPKSMVSIKAKARRY